MDEMREKIAKQIGLCRDGDCAMEISCADCQTERVDKIIALLPQESKCPKCWGKGRIKMFTEDEQSCPKCNGTGKATEVTWHEYYKDIITQINTDHQSIVAEKDREIARLKGLVDAVFVKEPDKQIIEQQKKIAELEEAIDNKNCDIDRLCEDIEELKAKAERYEKVLREIASHTWSEESQKKRDVGVSYERILEEIANQALGGK